MGVSALPLLYAKRLDRFTIRKRHELMSLILRKYLSKCYLNITDNVTGQVKVQVFDYHWPGKNRFQVEAKPIKLQLLNSPDRSKIKNRQNSEIAWTSVKRDLLRCSE